MKSTLENHILFLFLVNNDDSLQESKPKKKGFVEEMVDHHEVEVVEFSIFCLNFSFAFSNFCCLLPLSTLKASPTSHRVQIFIVMWLICWTWKNESKPEGDKRFETSVPMFTSTNRSFFLVLILLLLCGCQPVNKMFE